MSAALRDAHIYHEAVSARNAAFALKVEGREHSAALLYDRAIALCLYLMEEPSVKFYNLAARLRSQCIDEESS